MARYEIPAGTARPRAGWVVLILVLLFALFGARSIASYFIEYNWWKEMGQVQTWFALLAYSLAPVAIAAVIVFVVLLTAHARGIKFAGERMGHHRWYARISTAALLLLSVIIAASVIETWTVVRYFGGQQLWPERRPGTTPSLRSR